MGPLAMKRQKTDSERILMDLFVVVYSIVQLISAVQRGSLVYILIPMDMLVFEMGI